MTKRKPRHLHLPMGRPSRYETEAALEILTRMESGEFLHRICEDAHLPAESTVWGWVEDGKHPWFAEMFKRARRTQGHRWASEVVELADQSEGVKSVAELGSYQLRCNSRRWASARAVPDYYGDVQQLGVDPGRTEIRIYLPGKPGMVDRPHVIEGKARQVLEDRSDDWILAACLRHATGNPRKSWRSGHTIGWYI